MMPPEAEEFVELRTAPGPDAEDAIVIEDADDPAEPETPDAEDADDDGEEKPLHDEKSKHKGGAQARIDELTRKLNEERRARLRAETAVPRPAADAPAKPTPDQFEDYADYVDALTDWKIDERAAKAEAQIAERANAETATQANRDWAAKVEAASIPDYDEVVGKSDIPIAAHVGAALMEADRGPELAMHLAQNPDVADRLNAMSGPKAAMELVRIESTLEGSPPPRTTKAPAPITPVRPGSSATRDPAKMTQAEYNDWRKKELAKG